MIEGDTSEISVVICSLNRRDSLLLTLDSLEQQVWSGTWEVLVVDNGGTDGSFDAVCQRASALPAPLRAVREETRGLSHARNRALREARGAAGKVPVFGLLKRGGWVYTVIPEFSHGHADADHGADDHA